MVKLASTILAFPNHELNFNLMSELNSIEWTAQKLEEKKPKFTKVDTMLSIINGEKYKGTIDEDHIQEALANTVYEGIQNNIYKYVYGSPSTRALNKSISLNESFHIFKNIVNKINDKVQGNQTHTIDIYIEPLPNSNSWLNSMDKVIELCAYLNDELFSYDEEDIDTGVYFTPLIDTGTLLKTGFNFIATEKLAHCTDRIHLSQRDNTCEFKDIPKKVIKFVEQLCYYNEDLTISYEHINTNQNHSIKDFINYFKRLLLNQKTHFDVAVIGSGIYGEYIATRLANKNLRVALIGQEQDINPDNIQTASYVNQARVHNGYHYPRSISTAQASVNHYNQFVNNFNNAIINDFNQIYAIPKNGSLTSAKQFKEFADRLNVKCEPYFSNDIKSENVQGSFVVDEVAIDTQLMMDHMHTYRNEYIQYFDMHINKINRVNEGWLLNDSDTNIDTIQAKYIINATYSNLNEIEKLANQPLTPLKLETCEVALFKSKSRLKNAYTFMDGPFISIMPFSYYDNIVSMTSVTYTPHYVGRYDLSELKSKKDLMLQEAKRFLTEDYLNQLTYVESKYVIKAIPLMSENDDNRLIQINYGDHFVSILSGKLNAIYECDDMCNNIAKEIKKENVKGMIF